MRGVFGRICFFAVLTAALVAVPISAAADPDTTPPEISDVSVEPASVDVSGADATVTVSATITDDSSGVAAFGTCSCPWSTVGFRSPSSRQFANSFWRWAGGDRYTAEITIRRYAESGRWSIDPIFLLDRAGNVRGLDRHALEQDGIDVGVLVVADPSDTAPPAISEVAVDPSAVDVSDSDKTVTVSATITDDLSGVAAIGTCMCTLSSVGFRSPSDGLFAIASWKTAGGDRYTAEITIRRYSEAGRWPIAFIQLNDRVGNGHFLDRSALAAAGIDLGVVVTANVSDTTPPEIVDASIDPSSIDVSTSDGTATVSATLTDDIAGVAAVGTCSGCFLSGLRFRSPSLRQSSNALFSHAGGDRYTAEVIFRQHAEPGRWRMDGVFLRDRVGNFRPFLDAPELAQAGIDVSIQVSDTADSTPPAITPHVVGPLGAEGWYTGDAAISWDVVDGESPVTSSAGCDAAALTTDTAGQTFTCTATSGGGTSSRSVTIRRDATAPTVQCSTPAPEVLLGSANARVGAAVEDSLSGAVADHVDAEATTTEVGSQHASVTGFDAAGNSTTVACPYRVLYDFAGFRYPVDNPPVVNVAKAGTAIPVKFSLAGNQGLQIFEAGFPRSEQIVCDATAPSDRIEQTANAGGSELSYNASTGKYRYVWKTQAAWRGSCRELQLTLADGTSHRALFRFR